MFVVKDPDMFATQVIPQYFDHNKFSSFARQVRPHHREDSSITGAQMSEKSLTRTSLSARHLVELLWLSKDAVQAYPQQ
jgi:hypothetical protein